MDRERRLPPHQPAEAAARERGEVRVEQAEARAQLVREVGPGRLVHLDDRVRAVVARADLDRRRRGHVRVARDRRGAGTRSGRRPGGRAPRAHRCPLASRAGSVDPVELVEVERFEAQGHGTPLVCGDDPHSVTERRAGRHDRLLSAPEPARKDLPDGRAQDRQRRRPRGGAAARLADVAAREVPREGPRVERGPLGGLPAQARRPVRDEAGSRGPVGGLVDLRGPPHLRAQALRRHPARGDTRRRHREVRPHDDGR